MFQGMDCRIICLLVTIIITLMFIGIHGLNSKIESITFTKQHTNIVSISTMETVSKKVWRGLEVITRQQTRDCYRWYNPSWLSQLTRSLCWEHLSNISSWTCKTCWADEQFCVSRVASGQPARMIKNKNEMKTWIHRCLFL